MSMNNDGSNEPKAPSSIATPNLKRGPKKFLSDVKREMKKVSWPTRKEANRLTGVVISLCALVVLILTGMSYVAATLIDLLTTGRV